MSNRVASHVEPESVARIGGDEFALFFTDFDTLDIPCFVIQLILDSLCEPFRLLENEVFVTASVGIAVYPADGLDVDTLITNADSALYHAKDLGRNNFQFFREELNANALRHFQMANTLRGGVEREEFIVYYQPVIEVESGEFVGVEALVRWRRPDGVVVGPGEFIKIAEETGLIVPIGDFVLRESCRQLKVWHDAGYDHLHVAVNLSPRQFREKDLVDVVRRALANTELDARHLQLELTETILMESKEQAVEILNQFRQMGIRIAIDDFGTGYSSLSYLKRFPLDFLKIDQSFIKDITRDASDSSITRAIVAMAHGLGLEVIAEGVEQEAHLSFLLETGCQYAQGYHFSPPVPPEQILKMLGTAVA